MMLEYNEEALNDQVDKNVSNSGMVSNHDDACVGNTMTDVMESGSAISPSSDGVEAYVKVNENMIRDFSSNCNVSDCIVLQTWHSSVGNPSLGVGGVLPGLGAFFSSDLGPPFAEQSDAVDSDNQNVSLDDDDPLPGESSDGVGSSMTFTSDVGLGSDQRHAKADELVVPECIGSKMVIGKHMMKRWSEDCDPFRYGNLLIRPG